MTRFPMEYSVELQKNDGAPMELTAGYRPKLVVGPPSDLGGTDAWWSPEHLLVSSVASCMSATFFALAERARVHVGGYHCRANGVLDRHEGRIAFASVHLTVELTVLADDVERAKAILADAKSRCFVAASLRCPVEIAATVKAS